MKMSNHHWTKLEFDQKKTPHVGEKYEIRAETQQHFWHNT